MNHTKQHFLLAVVWISLILGSCQPSYNYVYKVDNSSTSVGGELAPDPAFEALIKPYKIQLDSQMNAVIGTAKIDIPRDVDTTESRLGNFCADLMLEQVRQKGIEADIAVVTLGGLRVPISKGDITVGLIFELMPFENELVVVTVDGSAMKKMFERVVGDQNISFSNTLINFRRNKFVSAKIGGKPFDEKKKYRVIVSDYLASGGDYMDYLVGFPQESIGIKLRDAIIEHIKEQTAKGNVITASRGDRTVFED